MTTVKTAIKSVLLAYDNIIYFFWRWFECNWCKKSIYINKYEPLISIIVPTYNTDHEFLRAMIQSVKCQQYHNWELVLVDDYSLDENVRTIIKEYATSDERIKYKFLTKNHHIAGATNIGIDAAKGEYIGLLDHDDVIYPSALFEIAKVINQNPGAKFIYTDEDKIIDKRRTQPFFKPSWNLGLLHCINYITHFSVIKKATLDKIGNEDGGYNGAQDWELFLRIGRNVNEKEIVHIPRILYGWRMHSLSTSVNMDAKPYVLDAQVKAVKEDLKIRGMKTVSVKRNERYPGQLSTSQNYRVNRLIFWDLSSMLGAKRALFIIISSRMALSRHIYRTASYDKIIR